MGNKSRQVTHKLMADGDGVTAWDRSQRLAAQGEMSRLLAASDLPIFGGNPSQAVRGWWESVLGDRLDPYDMALVWFGASRDQVAQMIEEGDPLGIAIERIATARKLDQMARLARVEDKNYIEALGDSPQDRKLYLQAHAPDKYVPAAKGAIAVGADQDIKTYVGIDPEEV